MVHGDLRDGHTCRTYCANNPKNFVADDLVVCLHVVLAHELKLFQHTSNIMPMNVIKTVTYPFTDVT